MAAEEEFVRLVDRAPRVMCPGCRVEMKLRMLVPALKWEHYEGTYRCPKCDTDTVRQFKCSA